MPLHIHLIDSVVPYLDEILGQVLQKHFRLKLRDSFRILTPDSVSAQDLERQILAHPRASGILIGKSVLSLTQWWGNIAAQRPGALAQASATLERSLFRKMLRENFPELPETALLQEFECLRRGIRLEAFGSHRLPYLRQYLRQLNEDFHCENNAQTFARAQTALLQAPLPELAAVEEIFFLGFTHLDEAMLACLQALLARSDAKTLHLFLPRLEHLLGPEGLHQELWDSVAKKADQITEYQKLSPAATEQHRFATPWHEARWIAEHFDAEQDGVFFPRQAPSLQLLKPLLEANDRLPRWPGPVNPEFASWLEFCEIRNPESPLPFSEFLEKISPVLQELQKQAALSRNWTLLQTFEPTFRWLGELRDIQNRWKEQRSSVEWKVFLAEAWEAEPRLKPALAPWLRPLEAAALKSWRRVLIFNCGENSVPALPAKHFRTHQHREAELLHEQRMRFENTAYVARESRSLSFSEYSFDGRAQNPSPFLNPDFQKVTELSVRDSDSIPYSLENLRRESARLFGEGFTEDQGNLLSHSVTSVLKEKVRTRPLSASYVDNYAQCPWRFFAHWVLRLDSSETEPLELDPKLRGTLLHQFLEESLARLMREPMSAGNLPSLAKVEETTQDVSQKMQRELGENGGFHPTLLQDEMLRIQGKAERLLLREIDTWKNSEFPCLPRHLEWSFGRFGEEGFQFPVDEKFSVPLSGAIDRIDVNEARREFLVIDYKSSGSEELASALRKGLSFQLFLYLHAVQKMLLPGWRALGGLYWDLKNLKRNQGMVIKDACARYFPVPSRGDSFLKEEAYESLWDFLRSEFQEKLRSLFQGDYRLQPKLCAEEHCPYHRICRYDPRS